MSQVFEKSSLTVDGNALNLSMPFSKVDVAKRTVSGYATLNNIDTQGDLVTAEASSKAFSRARGNLREMHDKVAVGKVIDFQENEFFDKNTGELYRGIYVTAYVSKGAESTWEKVVDGTLSGFSIGGEINDSTSEFVKDAGRTVRFITDYDLTELSLVDNPANQLANVDSFAKSLFSISKKADGSVTDVTGISTEVKIESVFICETDGTVVIKSGEESSACPVCAIKMENAGWFESGETDRVAKVNDIVQKFLNVTSAEAAPESLTEGGVTMAKGEIKNEDKPVAEGTPVEVVNPSEEFSDGTKVEDSVEESEAVDEVEGEKPEAEETAAPEEVVDVETDISKKIDELHAAVKDSLEASRSENQEILEILKDSVKSVTELHEKTTDLEKRMEGLTEGLEVAKNRQASLEKSLKALNDSDAVRKSADIEETQPAGEELQKSTWGGAFSGRSKFSVNNHM